MAARVKEYARAYREEHKERYRAHNRRSYNRMPVEQIILYSVRARAKRQGIPFALTLADIVVPEVCPLLDIPLVRNIGTVGRHGPAPNSPTLDRILPNLGYVPGNVWVVSCRANVIKNDASIEELEQIAARLRTKLAR